MGGWKIKKGKKGGFFSIEESKGGEGAKTECYVLTYDKKSTNLNSQTAKREKKKRRRENGSSNF